MIHKKKILLVSSSFYPRNTPRSFRATELAKEFSRKGYEVLIYTLRIKGVHDDFEKKYPGITIKDLGSPPLRAIELTGPKYSLLLKRAINRLGNLLFEYPSIHLLFLVKNAIKNERNHELLISFAVPFPVHWGVSFVWKKNSKIAKRWIADCGDPYMMNRHDTFNKLFYFNYFENLFLKKADFITVPFEEMRLLFNQKYKNKYRVIPQGFDFSNVIIDNYTKNKVPTFAFSGAIIQGFRDPFSLIEFLISLNIDFNFIFFTKQKELFNKYKVFLNKNIFLKDYIPREELIRELSTMDFLVNVNTDTKDGKINAIPTKLIDYRLSGRPILSYENSHLPKNTIIEFLEGNYENGFVDKNFERYKIEHVASQFLALGESG